MPADEDVKDSWSEPGDPEALRREFEEWDPRIGDLLNRVDKTFRWALYDREPLPTWSRGRLTLLGDAAHPMLPHLGKGANQSIEDGMALATILAQKDRSAVPGCARCLRAAAARSGGGGPARRRAAGKAGRFSRIHLRARDAELVAQTEFRKRLYAYDVVPQAGAAEAALLR